VPAAAFPETRTGHSVSTSPSAADRAQVAAPASARRFAVWTRLIQLALVVAAVVSIVLLRDELPGIAGIWRAVTHADLGWLAVVVVAEAGSMGAFALLQRRLLRAGGVRMSIGRANAVTYAGNALSTTLPAGPAVSVVYAFRQWRRAGASAQLATAVIVLGGIFTTTAYSLIGLITLLAEPHSRGPAALGLAALAAAAAAVTLLWWRPWSRTLLLRALRGLLRKGLRGRYTARAVRGLRHQLRQARGVVRLTPGDIGAITVFAFLNWLFDILALVAATRAVGVEVPPYAVAVSYFAAQAAGSLFPLLPGGLGAIEGGMTAALVAFGAAAVPAGAAVGLYRIVSFWAVVSIGWLAWLGLWLGDEAHRATWLRWRAGLLSAVRQAGVELCAIAGVAAPAVGPPYESRNPTRDQPV
jgi:hypothetical protein